ncbi:MAG: hypothetical protein WCG21_10790 [Eubacteriales bacterium]
MNKNIMKHLDNALQLAKEKQKIIKQICRLKTKKFGMRNAVISLGEKDMMAAKARKIYDAKISAFYEDMNQELKKAGYEELRNEYRTQKKEVTK